METTFLTIGFIFGIIVTFLGFLVLFAIGYNVMGTLLQLLNPEIFVPSLRDLLHARVMDKAKDILKYKKDED